MTEPARCSGGMVYVPAGEFDMGSKNGDFTERPVRRVSVSGFFMDKNEVTNSSYGSYQKSPSPYGLSGPDQPVVNVTWDEANAYCGSQGKRLPTEAEWEKAARGPEGYEYGTRSGSLNYNEAHYNKDPNRDHTADVCSYPENGYGLCDMSGNVIEWVTDWYQDDAYKTMEAEDPKGLADGCYKVVRGGAWTTPGSDPLRAAFRFRMPPDYRNLNFGFRCACDPTAEHSEGVAEPDKPTVERSHNLACVQPPPSCLCNTPGHVGGESIADISLFSLLKMLIFD